MFVFRVVSDPSLVDDHSHGASSRVQEGTVSITVLEVVVAEPNVVWLLLVVLRSKSLSYIWLQFGALSSTKVNSLREYADALESGDVAETFTGRFPAFVHIVQ